MKKMTDKEITNKIITNRTIIRTTKDLDEKRRLIEENHELMKMNGYEDIVTICDQALSAADDHKKALNLQLDIFDFAKEAADLIHHNPNIDKDIKNLLEDIMATAKRNGWQNKWE